MTSSSSRASSSSTSAGSTVATSSSSPSTRPLPFLSLFTTKGMYLDLFQKVDFCDLDDLKKVNKTIHRQYQTLTPAQEAALIYQTADKARPDLVHTYFRKLYRFLNPKYLTAPWAQFYLARMHIEGLGVVMDCVKGLKYLAAVPKEEKCQANLYYIHQFKESMSHTPPFTPEILVAELSTEFKQETEIESKLEATPKDTKRLAEIALAIGHAFGMLNNFVEKRVWFEKAFLLDPTLPLAKKLIDALKAQFKRLPSEERTSTTEAELKSLSSKSSLLGQVFLKYVDCPSSLKALDRELLSQNGEGAAMLGLHFFDPGKPPTSTENQLAQLYFQGAIKASNMHVEERKMECYVNKGWWVSNTMKHAEMEELLITGFKRTQSIFHLSHLATLYLYNHSYQDNPAHAWIILMHALSNHPYKGDSISSILKNNANNIWLQCASVFFIAFGCIDATRGVSRLIPSNLRLAREILNQLDPGAFEGFLLAGQNAGWLTPLHQKILNEIMAVEVKAEEKSSYSPMTIRQK